MIISGYSVGPNALKNSVDQGIIKSGLRGVGLCGFVDNRWGADANMVGSAQETAMSRSIKTFKHNRPRGCKVFENRILVIVFEMHDITNAESSSAAISERHFCGI